MELTDAQLRKLYQLIQENWRRSGLLYDCALDPESLYEGCYVVTFGTPVNSSQWILTKVYYLRPNGRYLDSDDVEGGFRE